MFLLEWNIKQVSFFLFRCKKWCRQEQGIPNERPVESLHEQVSKHCQEANIHSEVGQEESFIKQNAKEFFS